MDEQKPTKKKPVTDDPQTLADVLKAVSRGFDRLLASGLNRRAVVVLLAHETKVPQRDIKVILDGLGDLSKRYTA